MHIIRNTFLWTAIHITKHYTSINETPWTITQIWVTQLTHISWKTGQLSQYNNWDMGWSTDVRFLSRAPIHFWTLSELLWGPPSRLFDGYRQSGWGAKLTAHHTPPPDKSTHAWSYNTTPIRPYGVVFHETQTLLHLTDVSWDTELHVGVRHVEERHLSLLTELWTAGDNIELENAEFASSAY
jgi:hypothetical protein